MSPHRSIAEALLLPGNDAAGILSPAGPTDDLQVVPLTLHSTSEYTLPASGRGVVVLYGLPFSKYAEIWVVNALGDLELLAYATLPVNLPDNFTAARIIKMTVSVLQNQVLANASGAVASVQGMFLGTVVQGGISQLYRPSLTPANTFTISNLSQLSANSANSLFAKGSEGITYVLPQINRDFCRVDDGIPSGSNPSANYVSQNLAYSNFNAAACVAEYPLTGLNKIWLAGNVTVLTSDAFSVDVPYHCFIDYWLSIAVASAYSTSYGQFIISLELDWYGLDRTTVELTEKLVTTNSFLNPLTSGGSLVSPTLASQELHPTFTAFKLRMTIDCKVSGTIAWNPSGIVAKVNVKTPLYLGAGNTQQPCLIPFEGFSEGAPLIMDTRIYMETQPNTEQAKIMQARPRDWNPSLQKTLHLATELMRHAGLKHFYKPNTISGPDSYEAYTVKVNQVLDYLFDNTHPVPKDKETADFAFKLSKLVKNLKPLAQAGKVLYNNGGREMLQSAVRNVPVANALSQKLPARFAGQLPIGSSSSASFASGASFMMKRPEKSQEKEKSELDDDWENLTEPFCLSENQWNLPHVFVPGIFPYAQSKDAERGLFLLSKADPGIAQLQVDESKKLSTVNGFPIYGHVGEVFKTPGKNMGPMMLLEVVDIRKHKVRITNPGTGRSIGLALSVFPYIDKPLDLAFTGDYQNNQGGILTPMDPLVLARKLQLIPREMSLVTGPSSLRDSRLISYNRMADLRRDVMNVANLLLRDPLTPHFMPSDPPKAQAKVNAKTQPKNQTNSQRRLAKEALIKDLTREHVMFETFYKLTARHLANRFLPKGQAFSVGKTVASLFVPTTFTDFLREVHKVVRVPMQAAEMILFSLESLGWVWFQGPHSYHNELSKLGDTYAAVHQLLSNTLSALAVPEDKQIQELLVGSRVAEEPEEP